MSYVSEKTNSSNITNEMESEFKFNNYYKTIMVNSNNKKTNTILRKTSRLNSGRSSNIISLNKKCGKDFGLMDKFEENKNSFLNKNKGKNKVNLLFKNLLIREKQKSYRKNTVQVNNYNMYIREQPTETQIVVNNNFSLIQSFLRQTRSNFNNKYNVIYSISDWRQKEKVQTLFDSIKKYQHKNTFSDYLKIRLLKKSNSSKLETKIAQKNFLKKNNIEVKISSLNNYLTNDSLKNIIHKNNLIKIKTINEVKNIKMPNILRKNNTDIFYNNNTLFKTMPIKKLKMKKRPSFI